MERIRSRTAHTLGGAWRVRRGGLLVCAALLLVGVGCTGPRAVRMKDILPTGWVPSQPATQLVSAFNPQVQYLSDPTQDGVQRPGLVGQMFLIGADHNFTEASGDLYVMAEDITPRPTGQPPQVMEVWHFDPVALKKMRTTDERFGECYALFLPYPSNWKDVTQVRINTQYKPKGDPTKEPTLPGPPQTLMLDFTPPGSQPGVWLDKGTKVTGPLEMKSMPNVARDLARSGLSAPLSGPQQLGGPTGIAARPQETTTVPAGGAPPAAGPVMPIGGPSGPMMPIGMTPFAPPHGAMAPPPANIPPPMNFSADRPQASVRGPNGEALNVTAMALPPGQSMPTGWQKQADGSIQPAGVNTSVVPGLPATQPWQQPPQQGTYTQPSSYQPASSHYQPASSRIQHGAFNQPTQTNSAGSLPALPATAVPPQRQLPSIPNMPAGPAPQLPTASGVSGPAMPVPPSPGFDPNLPVGAWANQPPVPPAPPPNTGGTPTVPALPPLSSIPNSTGTVVIPR